MSVSDTNKNREAHGDSSFMLVGLPTSSENLVVNYQPKSRVTNHADQRIRQRVGVPRSAVRRLAARAKSDGIERRETTGSLRRYLDYIYHYNTTQPTIYVWSEKVFIFVDQALVTVLNLPTRYKSAANSRGKKNAD